MSGEIDLAEFIQVHQATYHLLINTMSIIIGHRLVVVTYQSIGGVSWAGVHGQKRHRSTRDLATRFDERLALERGARTVPLGVWPSAADGGEAFSAVERCRAARSKGARGVGCQGTMHVAHAGGHAGKHSRHSDARHTHRRITRDSRTSAAEARRAGTAGIRIARGKTAGRLAL